MNEEKLNRLLDHLSEEAPVQPEALLQGGSGAGEKHVEKSRQEKEHLGRLRKQARLKAAQLFLEGNTYAGIIVALAGGTFSPLLLERTLSRLGQDLTDGVGMAAFYVMSRPKDKPLKGSWPGGRGWPFMDRFLEGAAAAQEAELVLYLSRVALGAPLFLAAMVAAAIEEWGFSPETTRLAKIVAEKAIPLLRSVGGMEAILGRFPAGSSL